MTGPAKAQCPDAVAFKGRQRTGPIAIDFARSPIALTGRLPTLERILQLPAFSAAEVICGHSRIKQPVTWVHAAEVMDIWRFLTGGELLLSTGLELVRVSPAARYAYIQGLNNAGVRALGLELVQWLTEVPQDLLACATRLDMPILVFRTEVSFRELTRAAHQEILRPTPCHNVDSTLWTILTALIETGREHSFLQRELGPLLALPPRPRTTLLSTLDSLLETHFNIAASARALGVRRQSIYYRLNQLNGLLGSFDGPTRSLGLQVAFALLRSSHPHLVTFGTPSSSLDKVLSA